ncbi:hypothetical protein HaLaN_26715 [Haematococcus lacustris]|uniref:Uncharacterized protein n=1 Tax=Haematococcus lacustris TaxID=44745 RepID=A0A6A0A6X2_HAELA|nr:hypothetical protein HaLaN_26715 [Haematococcus lacustris]
MRPIEVQDLTFTEYFTRYELRDDAMQGPQQCCECRSFKEVLEQKLIILVGDHAQVSGGKYGGIEIV